VQQKLALVVTLFSSFKGQWVIIAPNLFSLQRKRKRSLAFQCWEMWKWRTPQGT